MVWVSSAEHVGPERAQFGILPAITGTIYSSILGLMLGTIFGLAIAIFLSEGFLSSGLDGALQVGQTQSENSARGTHCPDRMENVLKVTIELLAAIPSVVYGLWGIFVMIPCVRPWAIGCIGHLGWIPFFGTASAAPACCPRRSCSRSWCCRRFPRFRAMRWWRCRRKCAKRLSGWARRAGRRSWRFSFPPRPPEFSAR